MLRDFYAAQSGEFIQQVFEMKAHGRMQSAKNAVVGMLEVIVSNVVHVEADTTRAETRAAAIVSLLASGMNARTNAMPLRAQSRI